MSEDLNRELERLKKTIMQRLRGGLASYLTYHCPEHTLDVLESALVIGKEENLTERELYMLEAAALLHDTGFLFNEQEHEIHSVKFARELLPDYDLSPEEIEEVCKGIMATRLPQTPTNRLGEVLCDADLDYLGRQDFFPIGDTLFTEFLARGIVKDEQSWNRLQLGFLENHRYFTEWSRTVREPVKQAHLERVREIVNSYD